MNAIRVERRPEGVAVVTLDCPGKKVNTLSPALLEEFAGQADALLDDPQVKAIVVASAKEDTFIAGADLDLVQTMSGVEAEKLSREGNALLQRLATTRKPVVAAVHGAALGGGLEVALACHVIVASDDPATVLALPEVMLGLLPAAGGTQRLPRRLGLAAALPLLLTGKRLRARQAYRMGLVDVLTTPGGIADTAAQLALRLTERKARSPRRKLPLGVRLQALPPLRGVILSKARTQVARATRGLYPAPPKILECVEVGLKRGIAAGLEQESVSFGELVPSPEARHLVWIFHGMQEAKKDAGRGQARAVKRVAILGAGFMGAGVASVSLQQGPVVLKDISEEVLRRAARTVGEGIEKQVRSGALRRVEGDRQWARLYLTTDTADIRGADLVIEAVFEDLELKRRVLAEAEELISAEAVFASNTSALPIAEIAAHARHPDRVLGMHYFSPVPKMPLLEIVRAARTADYAVDTARTFGQAQGKTVIVVQDSPGFFTTRILAAYLNEAMLVLEEGAAIEAVDAALKDFGYPVGPLALIDEVGIDVAAHVAQDLGKAFAARGLGASPALPAMHQAGWAGRKNRKGFYVYPKKGRKRPNPKAYAFFGGGRRRPADAGEIQQRLALVMTNEAVHCLDEGVIASPRDGDLGAILGLGFPPFRGGPFHWMDTLGAAAAVRRLSELAERLGPRFAPAAGLEELAQRGGRFYPG